MIIVDSHCHLDMLKKNDEIDNYVKRAQEAGVKYLQTICTKLDQFDEILSIANKFQNIFASVGVHPSEVKLDEDISNLSNELLLLSKNDKVIGLGETGLDYYYNLDETHHELQRRSFEQHIIASQENNLPVIIHTRNAEDDTLQIIKSMKKTQDFPALIHCFTASKDFAREVLDLGLYISISGIVTFNKAQDLQNIVEYIPVDRLLVETDSPYLAPVPMRGKTNEPAYCKYVLEFIAKLKGVDLAELAQLTTDNFFRVFSKAQK